jgi:hypothetical protein
MLLDVLVMIQNIEKHELAPGVSKQILACHDNDNELERRQAFDIVSGDES